MIGTALMGYMYYEEALKIKKDQEEQSKKPNLNNIDDITEYLKKQDDIFLSKLKNDIAKTADLPNLNVTGTYIYPDQSIPKDWTKKVIPANFDISMDPGFKRMRSGDKSSYYGSEKNLSTYKSSNNPYYTTEWLAGIKTYSAGRMAYFKKFNESAYNRKLVWNLISTFNQAVIPILKFIEGWGKCWDITSTIRFGDAGDHGRGLAFDIRTWEKRGGRNIKLNSRLYANETLETRINAAKLYKFICQGRVPGLDLSCIRQLLLECKSTGWVHIACKQNASDNSSKSRFQIGLQKTEMETIYASNAINTNITRVENSFVTGLVKLFSYGNSLSKESLATLVNNVKLERR